MVRVSTTTREWTCGKSVTKGGMPTTTGSRECCGRCGPGLRNDAPHPRHGTIPPAMLRAGPSKQRTAPDASGTRMPSARRSRPRRRVDSRPAGRPCRARPCGWARAACFTWNTFGPSTAPVGLAPRARRVPKRSPRRVAIWPSVARSSRALRAVEATARLRSALTIGVAVCVRSSARRRGSPRALTGRRQLAGNEELHGDNQAAVDAGGRPETRAAHFAG